jgi:ATP-binding cassette subfamily B protein
MKLFKKYDKLNNSIQENVKAARVVKAYVREEYEIEKFNKASDELCQDFTKVEKVLALNSPIMQACIQTTMLFLAYLSAKTICTQQQIISGLPTDMNVGDYSALITYGVQMLSGIMMISFIFVSFSMSIECARRVCEVLNTKSTIINPENPVMEVADGSIVFDNVSFKYKAEAENYALYDISLKIKSGSTVGIIGGTGSSKTTLVNLISRLYDPTVGEIYVGDVNIKDYDIETLRNNVAVVLQKNVLFSGSILENLRWGNKEATLEECIEAAKLAQAHDFISSFPDGYDTHIEQGGTNVSGGQKQRLCIARALLKKPKVLILDDSTSAVDTKTDAFIRMGLKTYIPETTKIIIAQRIASVMESDLIIVLDNGTINGMGTHEELLESNTIYQEVYYSQNKVGDE